MTSRHGGTLIHAVRDELGLIEVIDKEQSRSLYLGSTIEQSCIHRHDPWKLQFAYYAPLIQGALLHPDPKKILVLGMGGGIVVKYLHQFLNTAHITGVEYREAVIDLAFSHFGLESSERLDIFSADASYFLEQSPNNWDLIIIDLYDAYGMSDRLSRLHFFDACREHLTPNGLISINLWCNDPQEYRLILNRICQVFEYRRLIADTSHDNIVVYGLNTPITPLKQLRQRCKTSTLPLNNRYWLSRLKEVDR